MKKTILSLALACFLVACNNHDKSGGVPVPAAEPDNTEYFKTPVKYYKEANATWFVVDQFHTDSSKAVKAYDENGPISCLFFTGYRFYGSVLGGELVYTCMPGYGEIHFKLSDVHKE